jgi:hypothetical protein
VERLSIKGSQVNCLTWTYLRIANAMPIIVSLENRFWRIPSCAVSWAAMMLIDVRLIEWFNKNSFKCQEGCAGRFEAMI